MRRPRGFCFATAWTQSWGTDFERFAAAGTGLCHNPWPQLVDLDQPECAWSQPLVRLYYLPTTLKEWGKAPPVPRGLVMAGVHERAHNCMNFTPAKDLARVLLRASYSAVERLLWGDDEEWNEGVAAAWQKFQEASASLSELGQRIALGEEAIATLLMLQGAEFTRPELSELVAAQTAAVGKDFVAVVTSLWRALLLVKLETQVPPLTALARLAILLQPGTTLQLLREGEDASLDLVAPATGHAARLGALVDTATRIQTGEELLAWLERETRHELHGWLTWQLWKDTLVYMGESMNSPTEMRSGTYKSLWMLAERDEFDPPVQPLQAWAEQLQVWYWKWHGPEDPEEQPGAQLVPVEANGRWYIVMRPDGDFVARGGGAGLVEPIRQQLDSRTGFRCPLLVPTQSAGCQICRCATQGTMWMKNGLERMARWAHEGRFGAGGWSDLPYPCGTGAS